MQFEATSQKVTWFRDRFRDGTLELKPPFQRKPVWSEKQKQYLIESILLGLPVPEIYLQIDVDEEERTMYYVVDGQQRIRAMLQFIGVEDTPGEEDFNRFALDRLSPTSPYRGLTYASLERADRDRFLTYSLAVRELKAADDNEVREVFTRFNKYVTKLNDQEIRQATYSGPFTRMASELADDDLWVKLKLVTPAQIRRLKDVEFVSELVIGLLHGPQSGSARSIDEYYAQYEDFEDEFPGEATARERFRQVRSIVAKLFSESSVETRFKSNRTDFYTLFVACSTLLIDRTFSVREVSRLRTTIVEFGREIDRTLANETVRAAADVAQYVRAVQKGANDKKRRTDRHRALLGRIQPHFKA